MGSYLHFSLCSPPRRWGRISNFHFFRRYVEPSARPSLSETPAYQKTKSEDTTAIYGAEKKVESEDATPSTGRSGRLGEGDQLQALDLLLEELAGDAAEALLRVGDEEVVHRIGRRTFAQLFAHSRRRRLCAVDDLHSIADDALDR